jgi:hypothetical protein
LRKTREITIMADKRPERSRGARKPEPKASVAAQGQFQTLRMTRKNWTLFGGGIAAIIIGFALLAAGDITAAPILLLLGYLVLIPWSLVAGASGQKPGRDRDGPKQG